MQRARLTRLPAVAALAAALALVPPAAGAQQSSPVAPQEFFEPGEVLAIESIVRNYLIAHPEIIIESLQAYDREQKQAAAAKEFEQLAALREALERDPDSVVGGNPDGDVSVIEFFDYRCPYCKRVLSTLTELRRKDRDVRVVYKEFPILGPDSLVASRAAIASRAQGKYLEFHDALMGSRGKLTEKAVFQIAGEVGLDVERLFDDMRAPEVNDILSRNYALAQTLGVRGTPAFIIGDRIIRGAVGLDQLQSAVEQARENCQTC